MFMIYSRCNIIAKDLVDEEEVIETLQNIFGSGYDFEDIRIVEYSYRTIVMSVSS